MTKHTDTYTFKKIKKVLEFVWDSPYSSFYRDKYKKYGIKSLKNINSMDDFKKLPYLAREEIVEAGPYKCLFLPKDKIKSVGFSSGTTNQQYPLVIFRTTPKSYRRIIHKKHLELKIKSMMLLYSVLSGQKRLLSDGDLGYRGIISFLGDIYNFELSAKIAARLEIDALQSTPTILYHFIPFLKKEYDLDKIKLIILGGEFCSEQKAALFKKVFKNAYLKFNFGGIETNLKGYRCDYYSNLHPRFFHGFSDQFYYETINQEEKSELIMTSLRMEDGMPLVRYRTGDAVKITDEKCQCGENIKIEVFGKLEFDTAKISGASIYSHQVSKAILPYINYLSSPDWKLHIFEEVKKDKIMPKLKLQLIPKDLKDKEKIRAVIEKGVSDNLYLSSKSTLSDLVSKGIFMPLEIEFVESFPFTLKQKHIISHLS